MSYIAPTVEEFKTRFPVYADVPDATVQMALDEASTMVDDTWVSQADYTAGYMLGAAHLLALDGYGTSTETLLYGFSSIKMGPLQLDRFKTTGEGAAYGTIGSTSYGSRYLSLLKRNHPPVLVV
jgi:hypothetical protein